MKGEVAAAQQELIEEFGLFEDWMDRYQYLIDLGKRLPALDHQAERPGRFHFFGQRIV